MPVLYNSLTFTLLMVFILNKGYDFVEHLDQKDTELAFTSQENCLFRWIEHKKRKQNI